MNQGIGGVRADESRMFLESRVGERKEMKKKPGLRPVSRGVSALYEILVLGKVL